MRRTPKRKNAKKNAEFILAAKKRRAKRLCGEGAYRKAVQTMTGEHAQMSAFDEAKWAAELIPPSQTPALAHSGMLVDQQDANLGSSALTGMDPLENDHPLKDARFACLTAPGPTGTRAEHAKECMGIKQRPLANRLARAMLRVQIAAKEGRLGPQARWLTRTKLMYLKKKGSVKPRPVRIGEFLRAAMAKKRSGGLHHRCVRCSCGFGSGASRCQVAQKLSSTGADSLKS